MTVTVTVTVTVPSISTWICLDLVLGAKCAEDYREAVLGGLAASDASRGLCQRPQEKPLVGDIFGCGGVRVPSPSWGHSSSEAPISRRELASYVSEPSEGARRVCFRLRSLARSSGGPEPTASLSKIRPSTVATSCRRLDAGAVGSRLRSRC